MSLRDVIRERSKENAKRDEAFAELFAKASAAGLAAGAASVPSPMVVAEADVISGKPLEGGKSWYVSEGACGFAWVNVRPGNSPFANWLKKSGNARAAYGGGVSVWVHAFGQSIARKEAFAEAFANVLRDAGIKAYAGSRLD